MGSATLAARLGQCSLGCVTHSDHRAMRPRPCWPRSRDLGRTGLGHGGGTGVLFLGSISGFFFPLSFFSNEKEAEEMILLDL